MIHFAQGQYLLLMFLIPVFFLGYVLSRRIRKNRIARFGEAPLMDRLLPYSSNRKGWVKLIFVSFAFFFFVIGLARPQLGATLKEQEVTGVEIMIALDVSNSMMAEDYYPNRLDRAKLAISKLVDRLQDDRIGLIVFAGQSFVQLPITTDYVSAKIFLSSITNESVPVQGTSLGDAITTSIRSFSMESENSRAIILITDGENHEDDPIQAAKNAVEMGIRVFCVGVGSAEGKPIPLDGELLKDKDGNIVVTKLDENTLREIANAGNGIYARAGNNEFGLNPIIDDIKSMDAKRYESVVFEEFDEQYMYFFGIALLFLLLELFIGRRKNAVRIFSNNKVASVVVFMFISVSAFSQTDRSQVRGGNRAFKKDNFQQAEIDYKRAVLLDSTSIHANYNLANTLYKIDNFDEAQMALDRVRDSATNLSTEMNSNYNYNLGSILIKQKKYQEAVDALKESLRKNPTDMEAKSNLAYAQKLLENQQQQQDQDQNKDDKNDDKKDQDKDNKDQNKDNQDKNQDQKDDPKEDPNKDQKDDKKDQDSQQQQSPPKITPQAAQQMLQAIEDKEKETQEKVKKEKALKMKSKQKEKNW